VGLLEQRVAKLRWVKSVEVRRRLPATVQIRVVEHDPAHVALVEGRLYYLNQDMSAYAPLKPGEHPPDRPLITGLNKAGLIDPDGETQSLLAEATKLLSALQAHGGKADSALSEIHLDRIWGLSLIRQDLIATVRLGLGGYPHKLNQLKKVTRDLKVRGELDRVYLIDLSDERRAVVRLGG
jgi:cell division septal protein FtsQ